MAHAGRSSLRLDVNLNDNTNSRVQEQEQKRARGAISCAECRRLKLKCDKSIPCSSCKRRGCASICPNGSLTTGQGTRFVLADTEKLHRKITEMSDRIRQLEDALAILQSSVNREQHPLLRNDLLKIKSGLELHSATTEGRKRNNEPSGEDADESEYIDAFGTLAVRDGGVATFYGRSAGSESLLLNQEDQELLRDPPQNPSILPSSVTDLARSFPSSPPQYATMDLQTLIERYLPPYHRAWHLCELYLEQESWHYGAVTRRELIEELFPFFYPESIENVHQAQVQSSSNVKTSGNGGPHELAVMFVIFCFGALTDPNLRTAPDNEEAECYYQLSKAALNLEPVLERPPSVTTVQTLSLMGIYQGMCSGEHSIEVTWAYMGLSTKLAQSIGLHRDCARWKLPPAEVQKRRALFWELFITDCWQSLATGRLPTFSPPFVDCELPQDTEQTMADDGSIQPSFPYWKARFGKECVSAVVQGTLTARAPKYSTIIELDRKIREMDLPKYAQGPTPRGGGLADTMRHSMPINYHHLTLVYVHRTFFAQALDEHPDDPLRSQYAASFLAGFRSACELLGSIRESFALFPKEIARFWVLFTHGFSCSVMLASVVIKGTKSKVAEAALMELRLACDLYEKAAPYGGRAVKFLPIIRRLHDKASQTYVDVRKGLHAPRKDIFTPTRPDEKQDELSIFSGRTHTLTTKSKNPTPPLPRVRRPHAQSSDSAPSHMDTSTISSPGTSDSNLSPHPADSEPYAGVHPALVDQLQEFDGQLNAQIRDAYSKDASMRAWVDQLNAQIPQHQHRHHPLPAAVPDPRLETTAAMYHHYNAPVNIYGQDMQHPPDMGSYYQQVGSVPAGHHDRWQVPHTEMELQYPSSGAMLLPPSASHHPKPVHVMSGLPPSEDPHSNYSLQETWSSLMQQWEMPSR